MKKVSIYVLLIFIVLLACKENTKNTKDDVVIDYKELLKDVKQPKESKKIKETKEYKNDSLCDVNYLNRINENIKNISYSEIETYLLSFNNFCKNNIEYQEYNNETLYNLLSIKSSQIVNILAKNKKVNKVIVLEEISKPISDAIDLNNLILVIEKANSSFIEKKEIIEALKKAKN